MHSADRSAAWRRVARLAALGVAVVALAGCATGYSFVQPDAVAAGGYYTSSEPYSGAGYYDYYGTGPYYPGTAGFGYYNGTSPYANGFGWFGDFGYGGGFGYYGPQFSLGIGLSNVWGFPGYWGPWYSTVIPFYGCRHCGDWRHHHRGVAHAWRGRDGNHPARAWTHARRPDAARWTSGSVAGMARWHARQRRGFAGSTIRRPLASAAFAPHDPGRFAFRRTPGAGFRAPMARSAYRHMMYHPALPAATAYWRGRAGYARGAAPMMSPHVRGVVARPAFHPQSMRAVPAAPPPSYRTVRSHVR